MIKRGEKSKSSSSSSSSRSRHVTVKDERKMFFSLCFAFRRKSERNFASALCNTLALTLLVVSFTDERWFDLHGGRCNHQSLGLKTFFTRGKLYLLGDQEQLYLYRDNSNSEFTACVDPRSIFLLRTIITLICLTIFSSFVALVLDLLGSTRLRRFAICQIISVFLCTCVLVLCFWLSEILYDIQSRTRTRIGKKVQVHYDIAYYLLVLANNFSLLSIILTLIRREPAETVENEPVEHLIERAEPAAIHSDPPPAYSE